MRSANQRSIEATASFWASRGSSIGMGTGTSGAEAARTATSPAMKRDARSASCRVEEPDGADEIVDDLIDDDRVERRVADAAHPLVVDDLVARDDATEHVRVQRRQVEAMRRVVRR